MTGSSNVTIIGAGWAGLASAVALAAKGYKIELFEASAQAGGRARLINNGDMDLDNGQHILLGAYHELLGLLSLLDLDEAELFTRSRLHLNMHCLQGPGLQLSVPKLTSPLHMLTALLGAKGISLREKWCIIRCWSAMMRSGFRIKRDQSVADYLQQQSPRLIKLFWRPICIAALNTDIDKASMQVFMNVLNRSFTGSRSNSDVLLPRTCLHKVLPQPALDYIQRQGGIVRTSERLVKINIGATGVTDIETSKGNYPVSQLVLATPFEQCARLLAIHDQFSSIAKSLTAMKHQPITTVYMQFPEHIQLDGNMQGLCDGISQWFIDRRSCGQAGLIAAVISAEGAHMQMDKQALVEAVIAETRTLFPTWPAVISAYITREKTATFACTPESTPLRPKPGHIGDNIWLAGDYVDTGLPATLEGAVSSGLQCARQLTEHSANTIL